MVLDHALVNEDTLRPSSRPDLNRVVCRINLVNHEPEGFSPSKVKKQIRIVVGQVVSRAIQAPHDAWVGSGLALEDGVVECWVDMVGF